VSSWVDVSSHWGEAADKEQRLFMVGFHLVPKVEEVSQDGAELVRVGHEFFRALFEAFVGEGGKIHLHASQPFDDVFHWPQLLIDEVQVKRALDALLARREASPYPVVVWFEPKTLRRTPQITEEILRSASSDSELLDELIGAGLPRLFLDEDWADLLSDPEDRYWIKAWLERAIAVSTGAVARFKF
jgi:hypothetical protein